MSDHSYFPYFPTLIWQIATCCAGLTGRPHYERVTLPMAVLRRFDCLLAPTELPTILAKAERHTRLKRWKHGYHCHRHGTAVGGPPASRAHNLTRTDN